MHSLLTNLSDLGQVMLAAMVFGAGLPAIFAFGIRFRAQVEEGEVAGASRYIAQTLSALCFAIVMMAVVIGVLFIAKGFLASRLDIHLFGA